MNFSDRQLFHPFSLVLLSGGVGKRVGSSLPKQYLTLKKQPVICHSLKVFLAMEELEEVVVVCQEQYHDLISQELNKREIHFATPGMRRQDSLYAGLKALQDRPKQLICVHDAARPLIDATLVRRVVKEASQYGAAVAAVPVKATVKVADAQGCIQQTLNREQLWEIQTPQVIRQQLLMQGFAHAFSQHLTVTDDSSLVEKIGGVVKIVEGSYHNIKLTTKEDLAFLQYFIEKNDLL